MIHHIVRFFKNPITPVVFAVGLSLVVILFVDRKYQILGIVGLSVLFVAGSIVHSVWQERVSSKKYRDDNVRLRRDLEALSESHRQLSTRAGELEREIPKVMAFSSVFKRIRIKDSAGNAELYMSYEGANISGMPMQRVRHVVCTLVAMSPAKISRAVVNREEVTPTIECRQQGTGYRTEIMLEALTAVDDGSPIATSYEALLEKEYADAFTKDGTSTSEHSIYLRTNTLDVVIQAPENYYFSYPDVQVRDLFNGMEIHKEEDTLLAQSRPTLDSSRQRIAWRVLSPRISYNYILVFSLHQRA